MYSLTDFHISMSGILSLPSMLQVTITVILSLFHSPLEHFSPFMVSVHEGCDWKRKFHFICIENVPRLKICFEHWPFFNEKWIDCVQINSCFFSTDSFAYYLMALFEFREGTLEQMKLLTPTASLKNLASTCKIIPLK